MNDPKIDKPSAEAKRLRAWLNDIYAIGYGRDGEVSAERLGKLVDEMVRMCNEALGGELPFEWKQFPEDADIRPYVYALRAKQDHEPHPQEVSGDE